MFLWLNHTHFSLFLRLDYIYGLLAAIYVGDGVAVHRSFLTDYKNLIKSFCTRFSTLAYFEKY